MREPVPMIVVGGVDLGESDRLVRFLCAPEGRVVAVARRARASRRRFAGMLDPGTRVRVRRRPGRGRLAALSEMDLLRAPDRARRELERIALLAYGCEICAALAPEEHPAPRLTRLLEVWLDLLEEPRRPDAAACRALEAKALTFAGLAPTLDRCARCGQPLADPVVFSPEGGGALHAWCGAGTPMGPETAAQLERLRRTPLAEVVNRPLPGPTGSDRWILADFISWQLGRALRSRDLLAELL